MQCRTFVDRHHVRAQSKAVGRGTWRGTQQTWRGIKGRTRACFAARTSPPSQLIKVPVPAPPHISDPTTNSMLFKTLAILALAAIVKAANPTVEVLHADHAFKPGEVVEIQWGDAVTGTLNIDIVDSNYKVLSYPITIASGIAAASHKYEWTVPTNLKTGESYAIRVWGAYQPGVQPGAGVSQNIQIDNSESATFAAFTVTKPSEESPCYVGEDCEISWDYPEHSNYPADVDVSLFKVGTPYPALFLGTVSSASKSFLWKDVPADKNIMDGSVFIAVSGQGVPVAMPGASDDMGGNSAAFTITEKPVEEVVVVPESTPAPPPAETTEMDAGISQMTNAAASPRSVAVVLTVAAIVPFLLML